MKTDALLLLCTVGGAAVGSLIDKFMGGILFTATGVCLGFVVFVVVSRRGRRGKPKLVHERSGR